MNKGLEAWERIKKGIDTNEWHCDYWEDIELIEKELKALEIIKGIVKIVDYSDYTIKGGNLIILQGGEIKTQEEYELLKEVLLCH